MKQRKTNVAVVTAAIFMVIFTAIQGTIVSNLLMPTIIGSLHGVHLMNWVFSIFLLTNAMAMPIYGKLSDKIGRKPVFLIGLTIFVIGSLLSGFVAVDGDAHRLSRDSRGRCWCHYAGDVYHHC